MFIDLTISVDEWYLPESENVHEISQHRNISERIQAAKLFVEELKIPFEVVCDSMNNDVYECYDSFPERLFIIEKGIVVYVGGYGPFDYNLTEVKDWLENRFNRK